MSRYFCRNIHGLISKKYSEWSNIYFNRLQMEENYSDKIAITYRQENFKRNGKKTAPRFFGRCAEFRRAVGRQETDVVDTAIAPSLPLRQSDDARLSTNGLIVDLFTIQTNKGARIGRVICFSIAPFNDPCTSEPIHSQNARSQHLIVDF